MPNSKPVSAYSAIDLVLGEDGCAKDTGNIGILCTSLEWSSFLNHGYKLKVSIDDPGYKVLKSLNVDSGYFRSAMACKFKARCRLRAVRPVVENETPWIDFFVTSLVDTANSSERAAFVFTAIDQPSWYLCANPASGKAYRGSISDVVRQVATEFAPGIVVNVDDTIDNRQNVWYLNRQSPKNLIMRLIDFGSSVSSIKGRVVVSSGSPNILNVVDQSKIKSTDRGFFCWSSRDGKNKTPIFSYDAVKKNSWSRLISEVYTSGISITTGQFLDQVTDSEGMYTKVDDKMTSTKINVKVPIDRAFSKPNESDPPEIGRTYVEPVTPIYSAGDLGLKYRDYISGKGRQMYLDAQYDINKLIIHTVGQGGFFDGTGLGADTVTIEFIDAAGLPFYIHGQWIVMGFRHSCNRGQWRTSLYLSRLSYDSAAKIVGQ